MIHTQFSVNVAGWTIHVSGDCADTVAQINRYLLPWLPRSQAARGDLEFVLSRTSSSGFKLQLNDAVVAENESMPYLFTLLQRSVDDALVASMADRAAIHASVAVYQEKAILMPGISGSGKTTLVRELMRRGAEYASDEFAILDASGDVHPYPRALMVRDNHARQHPVLASTLGPVRKTPAPVTLILFLRYEPGGIFQVEPVSASESLLRMLQNTPQVLSERPGIVSCLKAALTGANSLAGVRGDATEAAAQVLRMAATL